MLNVFKILLGLFPQFVQVFGGQRAPFFFIRIGRGLALRLRDGWLATGDIASMDEDGFFTLIDRKENMLVRNGRKVFPRQAEEVLFEHPAVALASVKRQPDEEGLMHLRAHVVLHRNIKISTDELRKYCAKRLHPSALPDSINIEQAGA